MRRFAIGELSVTEYCFSVIVPTSELTHEEILEATEALGDVGCTDASIRGHQEGIELMFDRAAASLRAAMTSAITDIENAGYRVSRVEMEREAVCAA